MCRSIRTLRAPYADEVTSDDMHAAITAATQRLLDQLVVRG